MSRMMVLLLVINTFLSVSCGGANISVDESRNGESRPTTGESREANQVERRAQEREKNAMRFLGQGGLQFGRKRLRAIRLHPLRSARTGLATIVICSISAI